MRIDFLLKIAKNFGANYLMFSFLHGCFSSTMIAPCPYCQSNACEVTKHGDALREEESTLPDDVSPSLALKHLYQVYMKNVHGILGKNKKSLYIRALFPNPIGNIWDTRRSNCKTYLFFMRCIEK